MRKHYVYFRRNARSRKTVNGVSLVVQWGRENETSMKPNIFLKSASDGDDGDICFRFFGCIFQKTKKLSSSFSMCYFFVFTAETGLT